MWYLYYQLFVVQGTCGVPLVKNRSPPSPTFATTIVVLVSYSYTTNNIKQTTRHNYEKRVLCNAISHMRRMKSDRRTDKSTTTTAAAAATANCHIFGGMNGLNEMFSCWLTFVIVEFICTKSYQIIHRICL